MSLYGKIHDDNLEIAGLKAANATLSEALRVARDEAERLRGELALSTADLALSRALHGETFNQRDDARARLAEASSLIERWRSSRGHNGSALDLDSMRWLAGAPAPVPTRAAEPVISPQQPTQGETHAAEMYSQHTEDVERLRGELRLTKLHARATEETLRLGERNAVAHADEACRKLGEARAAATHLLRSIERGTAPMIGTVAYVRGFAALAADAPKDAAPAQLEGAQWLVDALEAIDTPGPWIDGAQAEIARHALVAYRSSAPKDASAGPAPHRTAWEVARAFWERCGGAGGVGVAEVARLIHEDRADLGKAFARLRGALVEIDEHDDHDEYCDGCVYRQRIARRALAPVTDETKERP